jgi:hypothetical protein
MSCQHCMYISGHADECPTGTLWKISDQNSKISSQDSALDTLRAYVESLEERLLLAEETIRKHATYIQSLETTRIRERAWARARNGR